MEIELTKEKLRQFLNEHILISDSGLSKEAGLSPDTVYKILKYENRALTKRISDKLLPVMIKYGYKPAT